MDSIVHWNVRGARANGAWLSHRIFSAAQIIALQETFLSPHISFSVAGKTVYRNDRSSGLGGGLLTAVDSSLPSARLTLPFSYPPEAEVLGVEVRLSSRVLNLINVYIRQSCTDLSWLQTLVDSCPPPFVIVGDFNAHHSLWGAERDSPRGCLIAEWILHNEICILNTSVHTHIFRNGSSLLDLSLSSADIFPLLTFQVHPDPFDSDHCPVAITMRVTSTPQHRMRLDWSSAAKEVSTSIRRPTLSYEDLQYFCQTAINRHRRITLLHVRTGAPWWNSKCAFLLGQKRKFLRKARHLLSPADWLRYKSYAAKLRREMTEARRNYWGNVCQTAAKTGTIYRIFKALANRQADQVDARNLIRLPPGTLCTDRTVANAFAHNFCRQDPPTFIPLDFSANVVPYLRRPFELSELTESLRASSPTTPGKDGVSLRLLRALDSNGKLTLLQLYNKLWSSAIIPSTWKDSIILPLPKPGKQATQLQSYRPITLTSVFSKVFERILLHRLNSWCLANKTFDPTQHGFLPFRDCSTALMTLYNDLTLARKAKKHILLVALDISGAYDSVWLDGLAFKMLSAGVDGHLVFWIYTFFSHRTFAVRWRGTLSDPQHLNVGVAQGCVLSPVAFAFYLRDLPEALAPGVALLNYADDVYIYCAHEDFDSAHRLLQSTLSNISAWGRYWNMSFNASKCAIINFSNKRDRPEPLLRIHGLPIPWVSKLRILGLHFQANLTWESHVAHLRNKTTKKLNVLKCLASPVRGASTRDLLLIARATILGAMNHGAVVYSFGCRTTLQKLEPILNSAIRIATGLPRWTPIPLLLREGNMSTIHDTHRLMRNVFIVRHLALHTTSPICTLLRSDAHSTSILAPALDELFMDPHIAPGHILRWITPHLNTVPNLELHTYGFPFQNKNLHPTYIKQLFQAHLSEWQEWTVIATDASKSANHTSIAYWDLSQNSGDSRRIPEINSIFTAEALALLFALENTPVSGQLILLSDSLSVLSALSTSSYKSPVVILHLLKSLIDASRRLTALQLVWVPGHCDLPGNTQADLLARTVHPNTRTVSWVSPEDTAAFLQKKIH